MKSDSRCKNSTFLILILYTFTLLIILSITADAELPSIVVNE